MRYCIVLILCAVLTSAARADEGMWTLDRFPSRKVAAKYGFTPSQAWLDHVRNSALRIAGGCSASFVSPDGLVMTNHHCAVDCADQLSTPAKNLVQSGFYAKEASDEPKCDGFELDQLIAVRNVTQEMQAATAGTSGNAFTTATRTETAKLKSACGNDPGLRCDVVSLYHGGIYDLYKYRRYRDVRLVFIPEFAIGQFGGDPDNFNFPRYGFDVSFLRAYAGGKPAATSDHLRWSKSGSKPGELVFVAGNPGGTDRELTVAQLEFDRDIRLPETVANVSELRGVLEQFQTQGPEQLRTSRDQLFFTENSYKVLAGRLQALDDPVFFSNLAGNERVLRAKVAANPATQRAYGSAWSKLAALQAVRARLRLPDDYYGGGSFHSTYFTMAQKLVRLPIENNKPNGERLPEFSDAALVTLPEEIFDPSPIYPAVEELNLALGLDRMRRIFGPEDPVVKIALDGRSPVEQAHYLVTHTQLGDVAYRKKLYAGGEVAIQASDDAFVQLALRMDDAGREARKRFENDYANPSTQLAEQIAKARFAVEGTSSYPDATFTLRLSYGTVQGFSDVRGTFGPFTTIGGLFDRASDADPYVLPQSWIEAKDSLDLQTPMNLSTSNDVIGGNSGSPLINQNAEVVGVIFDGNIHSLGGDYGYDPRLNRSIAVDSRAIIAGLTNVYHAGRLVNEILNDAAAMPP